MRNKCGLKERYPAFFRLGESYAPMTREEEVGSTFERRLRAVWPFIVKRIDRFYREKLKPGERAVFDPEDIAQTVWIALREKDGHWDHLRGRYITFAGRLVRHELCAIRESSRTVASPRNTGCRLKEYQQEEDAGVLTERKAKTREAIRQSVASYDPIDGQDSCGTGEETIDECWQAERVLVIREAIDECYPELTPIEALIVSMLAPRRGAKPKRLTQIAIELGITREEAVAARVSALDTIRRHLVGLGHLVSTQEQACG